MYIKSSVCLSVWVSVCVFASINKAGKSTSFCVQCGKCEINLEFSI